MKDTSPRMHDVMLRMMMRKDGVERLKMGASMYDAAKSFVLASFKNENVANIRAAVFMRFYGNDFSRKSAENIVRHLSEGSESHNK